MYRKSNNPIVEELTKSHTERTVNLTNLQAIKLEDGVRMCAWCNETALKSKHPNHKYCSPDCSRSAIAWAYPQKEEGLSFLLIRQSFCCNICQHDWKPFIETEIIGKYYGTKSIDINSDWQTRFNWYIVKRLKSKLNTKENKHLRPEVDHVIPVYKGGQSIGLENHQALCYTCHKTKSKVDNSGPRKKKIDK